MQYMLLLYGDESQAKEESMEPWMAFGQEAAERGVLRSGEAVHPTSEAQTVRVRNGETLVSDGPYAETKEQMGGFYLLDCKDLDEAIEFATKIPRGNVHTVEVRPVMQFEG